MKIRPQLLELSLAALLALPILAAPNSVLSQEAEVADSDEKVIPKLLIEAITVVGSQLETQQLAGSSDFLNAADLAVFDYGDVNRLLRQIPGVNIQEEDGYGLRPNIGLRATGLDRSSKIALMEDGVLIAPAPYAAPSAYYFPHVARMSAVEVVKGPSAIKYGPNTVGGAINFLSTPARESNGLDAEVLYGSDSFLQVHASGTAKFALSDALDVSISGEALEWQSNGFKEIDGGGNTGFDIDDYVGKIQLTSRHSDNVTQSIQVKIQTSDEISNETYLGLTEADYAVAPFRRYRGSQRDEMDAKHDGYQATYRADFVSGLSVTALAYRNEFSRDWFKLDKVADPIAGSVKISSLLKSPGSYLGAFDNILGEAGHVSADNALSVKHNNRSYLSKGIQTAIEFPFESESISHNVTASVRYHEDKMDRFQWVDKFRMDNGTMVLTSAGVPGTDSNRIDSAKAWSGYIQDEIVFGRWTATPGFRIESVDLLRQDYGKSDSTRQGTSLKTTVTDATAILPGIAVSYEIDQQMLAFAGVHRGFAPPAPGKNAEEETSINYEAGLRYFDQGLSLETVGFFTDYENLVGQCTNSTGGGCVIGDQFDGGEVHAYGLEATASYDLAELIDSKGSIPLNFTYTYTQARFQTSFKSNFGPWKDVIKGDNLPYIPSHQATVSLGIIEPQWSLQGILNYVSRSGSQAGQGPVTPSEKIDSRVIVDLGGSVSLTERADLVLRIENLFDSEYIAARRPAGLRPGQPFSLKAGFKVRI